MASLDLPELTPAPHGRVLLVEDDTDVAEVVCQALRSLHDVTWHADANDALAAIAGNQRFDVILCDLLLPGMSGIDLHAALVLTAPNQAARMVFMSGSTFCPSSSPFRAEIDNPFIEKPFSIRALREVVARAIDDATVIGHDGKDRPHESGKISPRGDGGCAPPALRSAIGRECPNSLGDSAGNPRRRPLPTGPPAPRTNARGASRGQGRTR